MSLRWFIHVCRTCSRQAEWPYCEHLKDPWQRTPENMRSVIVRATPQVEKEIRAEMQERATGW